MCRKWKFGILILFLESKFSFSADILPFYVVNCNLDCNDAKLKLEF